MKFVLERICGGCRLGSLAEVGQKLNKKADTPLCMLYTRTGSAPNLTRDMLDRVGHLPLVAQMPLTLLAEHHESIAECQKGLSKFTAMDDFLVFCTLQDPAEAVRSGYNDRSATSLWGRGGNLKVDVNLFMKIQEAFRPDWYLALCDSDTPAEASRKRTRKSVDRTLEFLDQCIERHQRSDALRDTSIIAAVEGGHILDQRVRSARETALRDAVSGFSIEGFHNFGAPTEDFPYGDVRETLEKTIAELPECKPRLLPGILTPDNIMLAVELGLDVFDSSYPYIVTERGSALVFSYDLHATSEEERARCCGEEGEVVAPSAEAEKHSDAPPNGATCADAPFEDRPFEISLKDKKYSDDFSPLLKGCLCYTCTHHTRAYVNHLVNTSELLAGVLLMVHNFHQYFGFFEAIRQSLRTDQFNKLKGIILQQKRNKTRS